MTVYELRMLKKCLESLAECTSIPLTFFDDKYDIKEEFLIPCKFCHAFSCYYDRESVCRQTIQFSIDMAMELGSPYFFYCGCGLVQIAMPVILHGKREGCVLAGPFSMGDVDEEIVRNIMEMSHITPDMILSLLDIIKELPNFTADKLQKFSDLLYTTISGCYQNGEEYNDLHAKYNENIRVGNTIGKNKREYEIDEEFEDLIDSLKQMIISRQKEKALEVMDDILEKILIDTSGNLDLIKLRVIDVYVQMFEMAQKRGVIDQKVFIYKGEFLNKIIRVYAVADVLELMKEEVAYYVEELFKYVQRGHSPTIEKALEFINQNYMEKISLKDLSQYLHINESYLSNLFKKEFSQCFTDYLNEIRINHSILLMRDQNKNLLEIANSVGFNNQSYYTKIFIKNKGISPKQFRKELLKTNRERVENYL